MPTVAEVTVQPTDDPNIKAYHTRFEMSSGPESGTRGNEESLSDFGRLILEIRGVSQVRVTPYVLLVTKAMLFSWGEILPKVEDILRGFVQSQKLISNDTIKDTPSGRV